MKIAPYIEKLNSSGEYKSFLNDNSDAFMVAGFFVLDFEHKKNIHQIDYYIPSQKKFAAFTLDDEVKMQFMNLMDDNKIPEKLEIETQIDLDALQGIVEDEMKNRGFSEKINKIIAVLQTKEGKKIWNLNCILSGMEILRAHIEDKSKSVLKMEKVLLTDIMKQVPSGAQNLKDGDKENLKKNEEPTKKELKEEMKKLEEIEEEIKDQKKELKEEIDK